MTVPRGTIMPWLLNLSGTPVLPENWALCDGNGGRPNLNGERRFLRGTTSTTGGTGGHHTHSHYQIRSSQGETYSSVGPVGTGQTSASEVDKTIPSYYDVVWIIKIA